MGFPTERKKEGGGGEREMVLLISDGNPGTDHGEVQRRQGQNRVRSRKGSDRQHDGPWEKLMGNGANRGVLSCSGWQPLTLQL